MAALSARPHGAPPVFRPGALPGGIQKELTGPKPDTFPENFLQGATGRGCPARSRRRGRIVRPNFAGVTGNFGSRQVASLR